MGSLLTAVVADSVISSVQAPLLLDELRSAWGMRPPSVASEGNAAIEQYVYSSNVIVR